MYFYYADVRRTMRTANVSYLLKVLVYFWGQLGSITFIAILILYLKAVFL